MKRREKEIGVGLPFLPPSLALGSACKEHNKISPLGLPFLGPLSISWLDQCLRGRKRNGEEEKALLCVPKRLQATRVGFYVNQPRVCVCVCVARRERDLLRILLLTYLILPYPILGSSCSENEREREREKVKQGRESTGPFFLFFFRAHLNAVGKAKGLLGLD
ncbi:hypothetical protein F4775DRAFT_548937 [Biscogniauxia sp. FL1348]|nr:hypothetical protein F4775DRAFT_548937 [Biscogniauxia sp. FL1348]